MLTLNTLLEGRYRIIRKLGEGGMGVVYEAIDERLNSLVAVKETVIENDRTRDAFAREAGLLANLRHPSLPTVRDHFAEDERQFLVMEFIPGNDLAQLLRLRGRAFSETEVLEWGDELLKVLEYLHKHNPPILHRDIKPANLKLTEQGELFLLDFGLAKGAAGQMTTLQTSKSVRAFTPVYAPLEQIHGVGTDPRSDLYSLGTTLYHLLTGVMPTAAPTRFTLTEEEEPDPLRPATEVNPEVSIDVSAALSKAMALSRNQRFATATEMRQALRKAVASKSSASGDEERKAQESLPASAQPVASGSESPRSTVAAPTVSVPVQLSGPETLSLPNSEQPLSVPQSVKIEPEPELITPTLASPTQKSEAPATPAMKSVISPAEPIKLPEKAGAMRAIPRRKRKRILWIAGGLIGLMIATALTLTAIHYYFSTRIFSFAPGAVVTGRVLTYSGQGVADATITLQRAADNSVVTTQTTDSSGAYKLTGIISGNYTIIAEASNTKNQQPLTITDNASIELNLQLISEKDTIGREGFVLKDLYMRSDPSTDNAPIGIAEKGSRLRILAVHGNWYEVQILEHGRTPQDNSLIAERGWGNKKYVTLDEQSAPSTSDNSNQSSAAPAPSPTSTEGGSPRSAALSQSGSTDKAANVNENSKSKPARNTNSASASKDAETRKKLKRIKEIFEGNP